MGTILVVDDSTTIRRIINRNLTEMGYEVLEAVDGDSCLKTLVQLIEAPVLIILDWNMPNTDSIAVLKTIKTAEPFLSTPVIMLISEGDPNFGPIALQSGATACLTKPFDHLMLQQKIKEALGLPAN
jgi:two-component system, chemotaxis family, chemotaxis protein CheY